MSDAFLQSRTLQPKREICEYLEQNGIRVPHRIGSLRDAIREKHAFIIRGEHPQDYDGASDLLKSIVVKPDEHFSPENQELHTEEELIEYIESKDVHNELSTLRNHLSLVSEENVPRLISGLTGKTILRYCKLLEMDPAEYLREVSFSYWEYIKGCNHAVIADTAIRNRYHIFSFLWGKQVTASYLISDQGNLEEQAFKSEENAKVVERVPRLIELYESVRSLPAFDRNHCPIVEMQTSEDDVDYCLQVHRTRDSDPSTFDLGRPKEETYFARGITPPEGKIYDVSLKSGYKGEALPAQFEPNTGAYLLSYDNAFIELNLKRRAMNMVNVAGRDDRYDASKMALKHDSRSAMFKPLLSVQTPIADVFEEELITKMMKDPNLTVPLKITSDGRRALVERA